MAKLGRLGEAGEGRGEVRWNKEMFGTERVCLQQTEGKLGEDLRAWEDWRRMEWMGEAGEPGEAEGGWGRLVEAGEAGKAGEAWEAGGR